MQPLLLSMIAAAAFSAATCTAQHEADNWYFGWNAGLSFGSGVPVPLIGGQVQTVESSVSLSDQNGNLLFYSGAGKIWGRDHQLMPNGTGLNSGTTCSQMVCTPYPGQDSLFYLFTPPDMTSGGWFCYSIVDLTLNGGFGDVINKNTQLFTPSTEKVTAVRHANGTDIWVIGHGYDNADFYTYRITSAGIDPTPVISTAGTPHTGGDLNKIGYMKASLCGDKIALAISDTGFVELFDFDNVTGTVSNAVHLGEFTPSNFWGIYGVEFSPDGSRLYVAQEGFPALLVQYDLLAGSPAAMIASADTIVQLAASVRTGGLQLAPDGRIYIPRLFPPPATFLSCINDPNELGPACLFVDTAVVLTPSGSCMHGLPNYMSSTFLTPSSSCDLTTAASDAAIAPGLSVFPNPAEESVSIALAASASAVEIRLLDPLGRIIRTERPAIGQAVVITWSLAALDVGMYFVEVRGEALQRTERLIKQ